MTLLKGVYTVNNFELNGSHISGNFRCSAYHFRSDRVFGLVSIFVRPKAKSAAPFEFYQVASSGSHVDRSCHVDRGGGRGGNDGTFGGGDADHTDCKVSCLLLAHPLK